MPKEEQYHTHDTNKHRLITINVQTAHSLQSPNLPRRQVWALYTVCNVHVYCYQSVLTSVGGTALVFFDSSANKSPTEILRTVSSNQAADGRQRSDE